jgi:hypothetical protein
MKRIDEITASAASASRIVTKFLTAFLSGEHDEAASLLTSGFSFRAPLIHHGGNKAAYFAGAKEKVKYFASCVSGRKGTKFPQSMNSKSRLQQVQQQWS